MTFDEQVAAIPQIGLAWHRETILRNSFRNAAWVGKTIRDIEPDERPCLVVSAGPSLYRENILARLSKHRGGLSLLATDGAYIQCLKVGIVPDWVITLDPHPTRIVRWFGDPDLEAHSEGDDYFSRQDLDLAFREKAIETNQSNIALVDAHVDASKVVAATTCPETVVKRLLAAGFDPYWFAPLVDAPCKGSLTRIMCAACEVPAMNTGGTVGTAAWAFAHQILKSTNIAIVGCDLGYYPDTPLEQTQSWHMLGGDKAMYPTFDGHWGPAMTDPTYFFYLNAFRDLLEAADARITNCSGAGLLCGDRVDCTELETWLQSANM